MEAISVATADWGTIRKARTGRPDDGCILAQLTVYASETNGRRRQIHTMLTQAPLCDHGRMPQMCSSPNGGSFTSGAHRDQGVRPG
jgi:hypothetical protein